MYADLPHVPPPATIRALRKEAGLPQHKFADYVGIGQPQLSRVENGTQRISAEGWCHVGPHIAVGADQRPLDKTVWLLAAANPQDGTEFVPLHDEHGKVGLFFDGKAAHNCACALAAIGTIAGTFALPCSMEYAVDTAQDIGGPDNWYVVDMHSGADPVREFMSRGARVGEYLASVLRMAVLAEREAAEARA